MYGSYFPVFRISNLAVSTLISGYIKERVVGYCETLVPTFLKYKDLSIAPFSKYNIQDMTSCVLNHKVGEYVTDKVGV